MRRPTWLLAAVLALGLVATGCGGGDDGDGNGGEELSRQEFVSQANGICQEGRDRFAELQQEFQKEAAGDPTQLRQRAQEFVGEIAPILDQTASEIGELTPPAELQDTLDRFVAKTDEVTDQLENEPAAFVQEIQAGRGPIQELSDLAGELGLENCGLGGN